MKKETFTTYFVEIENERPSLLETDNIGVPPETREAYIRWLSRIGRERLREELYMWIRSSRNGEMPSVNSQLLKEMCLQEMLRRALIES